MRTDPGLEESRQLATQSMFLTVTLNLLNSVWKNIFFGITLKLMILFIEELRIGVHYRGGLNYQYLFTGHRLMAWPQGSASSPSVLEGPLPSALAYRLDQSASASHTDPWRSTSNYGAFILLDYAYSKLCFGKIHLEESSKSFGSTSIVTSPAYEVFENRWNTNQVLLTLRPQWVQNVYEVNK